MSSGIADTNSYLPVHTLSTNIGYLCGVLPPTSKVGTKSAALKANPTENVLGFGTSVHPENLKSTYVRAEQYLIKVLKHGSPVKCMDKLRYLLCH